MSYQSFLERVEGRGHWRLERKEPPAIGNKDLTKLSKSEQGKVVDWYVSLPLKELRKRQDLTDKQIERAYKQKNDQAMLNLQVQRALLDAAVMKQQFGESWHIPSWGLPDPEELGEFDGPVDRAEPLTPDDQESAWETYGMKPTPGFAPPSWALPKVQLDEAKPVDQENIPFPTKRAFVKSVFAKRGTHSVPGIDPDEYPPIPGMEGPFRFGKGHGKHLAGRVLYYDPREGQYYDRKTDMYVREEQFSFLRRGLAEEAPYTADTVDQFADDLKAKLKDLPWVEVTVSRLGGKDRASVMVRMSLDPVEDWNHKILHNSRYSMFHFGYDGKVEQFSKSHKVGKFRKTRFKSAADAATKIHKWVTDNAAR